jgi:hypothetical protein
MAFIVICSVVFLSGTYNRMQLNYTGDYFDYGGWHKIKGKLDALDVIYQDAEGKPFNVLVYTPPVYTYAYDYLFQWYGAKKYSYVPGKDATGTFYLLMEEDTSSARGHIGWMETVVKTGDVVWTHTLPSNLIIQKRVEQHEPINSSQKKL